MEAIVEVFFSLPPIGLHTEREQGRATVALDVPAER
jgi:hypothetical protein